MHARIEAGLENWGHFVYRRAWWVLVLALAMTAGTATQLKYFYIDASLEGFFHQDDPVRVIYDEFREQYGRDTFILISLEPNTPIFEREFLETLRELHARLENEVPLVVDVTSLVNARITRGEGDELVVGELMEDWPEDDAALRALESQARANPFYQNSLISGDGKLTSIMVELEVYSQLGEEGDALDGFADGGDPGSEDEDEPVTYLTGAEEAEVIGAVLAMLEEYRSDDLTIEVAGTPVLTGQFALMMQADMGRFTALALLIIVISLAMLFRRVGAVLVPLVTVICSVISTMSIMAGTGTPLTSPTQIIPTFLLAVGVGGSVHIMTIYYQGRRRGLTKEDGLAHALGHSGLAVIMTSLTTAGGLLSFVAAELLPISHFGVFAPIGVMVSLFYTLTMLPALVAISPGRSRAQAEAKSLFFTQRLLVDAGVFSTRHSTPILVATFVLVVVSVYGASMIRVAHSPFDWFPEGDMVRRGMETMDTNMGGMGNIELIVDTGRVNGFHDPAFLE